MLEKILSQNYIILLMFSLRRILTTFVK